MTFFESHTQTATARSVVVRQFTEVDHKKTSLANRQAGEKANILSLLDQAAPKNYLSIMMRAR